MPRLLKERGWRVWDSGAHVSSRGIAIHSQRARSGTFPLSTADILFASTPVTMVRKLSLVAAAGALAATGIDARNFNTPFYARSVKFARPSLSGVASSAKFASKADDTFLLGVPRGGAVQAATSSNMVTALLSGLLDYIKGTKSDTLALLGVSTVVAPICNSLGISNILGFLVAGMALGPNGIKGGIIDDVHRTEMLADLGM